MNDKETNKKNENIIEDDIQEVPVEKVKCTECEYQTNIRVQLRSPMMAHKGQYQCQRGCKEF